MMKAADQAQKRRSSILSTLQTAQSPITAAALAGQYHVSRQIIVGDIALLRASGVMIIATPHGYTMEETGAGFTRRIACRHTAEQIEDELNLLVDNGCCVEDVVVEHPIYGELTGRLRLRNRHDVSEYLHRVAENEALPLSNLTDGTHLHTVRFPDEASYRRVTQMLDERGYLIT